MKLPLVVLYVVSFSLVGTRDVKATICEKHLSKSADFDVLIAGSQEKHAWLRWGEVQHRICHEKDENGDLFQAIPTLLHRSHKYSLAQLAAGQGQGGRVMRNLITCSQLDRDSVTAYYDDSQLENVMEIALNEVNPRPTLPQP